VIRPEISRFIPTNISVLPLHESKENKAEHLKNSDRMRRKRENFDSGFVRISRISWSRCELPLSTSRIAICFFFAGDFHWLLRWGRKISMTCSWKIAEMICALGAIITHNSMSHRGLLAIPKNSKVLRLVEMSRWHRTSNIEHRTSNISCSTYTDHQALMLDTFPRWKIQIALIQVAKGECRIGSSLSPVTVSSFVQAKD
jgi:hypothetical protein